MYKIIGADSKEYGPVDFEALRHWCAQGRVNAQTLIRPETGGEWQPMAAYPEFAEILGIASPAATTVPPLTAAGGSQDGLDADYDLDIGVCVRESWEAFQRNFGTILGASVVFLLIQGGISGLAQIPFAGLLLVPVLLVVTGPLMAGIFYVLLRNLRREAVEIGDVFAGFKLAFGQLILGYVVPAVLVGAATLPGGILAGIGGRLMAKSHSFASLFYWALTGVGVVLVVLPMFYLMINWAFTLPLIIDKRMDFWSAMRVSRQKVGRHWWAVFGLSLVCGLIYMGGAMACCIGIFFTFPIGMGALMAGYERIFNGHRVTASSGPPPA